MSDPTWPMPPQHIDPDTLVKPLGEVTYPLPPGTGLYDHDGNLVAVLGESIELEDEEGPYFTVPLLSPTADPGASGLVS